MSSKHDNIPEEVKEILYSVGSRYPGVVIDGCFYSNNLTKQKEYFAKLREAFREVTLPQSQMSASVCIELDDYSVTQSGFDSDHNYYWWANTRNANEGKHKQVVIVLNKYGQILDAFQYGEIDKSSPDYYDKTTYPTSGATVAVAPSGDVWFMVGNEKGYNFYKAERQW